MNRREMILGAAALVVAPVAAKAALPSTSIKEQFLGKQYIECAPYMISCDVEWTDSGEFVQTNFRKAEFRLTDEGKYEVVREIPL